METRTIQWAAAAMQADLVEPIPATVFGRVCTDSRQARAGDLFFALSGERFDGHDFVDEVIARGVSGVVVCHDRRPRAAGDVAVLAVRDPREALGRMAGVYRSEFRVPMVCVVGSNGKTTSKEMVAALLLAAGPVLKSEASFNNDVGVPLTLMGLETRHRFAVVEAGTNHPGELGPLLDRIVPTVGLLTGIGREHLEHFGSEEGVAEEEGTIASVLPSDGVLVMEGDGAFAGRIEARAQGKVIRFGTTAGCAWRVVSRRTSWEGEHFVLESSVAGWSGEWLVGVPGRHMATNAAGSLAVACVLGISPEAARKALPAFGGARQRMERIEAGAIRVLNDCYNANADSMRAGLQTLFDLPCAGRRVAVLGDMAELGPASEPAHGEVGRFAATGLDLLLAVGERAGITAGSAMAAGLADARGYATVEALLPVLRDVLQPGDAVLIKASRSARLERVAAAVVEWGREGRLG